MTRTRQRCPLCEEALTTSRDMWGQFYLCPQCGFSTETDDEIDTDADGDSASAFAV